MPSLIQIVAQTPLWVCPLKAFVFWRGWLAGLLLRARRPAMAEG